MTTESEARAAARTLVQILEEAKPVPLTGQVRFDKQTVYELADEVESAAGPEPSASLRALVEAAAAAKDATYHAMPVPLADQVRVPRERVEELVGALRVAGA